MKIPEQKENHPPRWAERFLGWYCKPELLEDLQGDLNEYFERNVNSQGIKKARLIYIFDVFKFFRLYTVRKPEFIHFLIQWIMIGSYVKTSSRNIVRNKLFSTINIVGLAISMSVGLFLIGLLSDMSSYDHFHKNNDRIYRVITNFQTPDQKSNDYFASTSLRAGQVIRESITGVEDVAVMFNGIQEDIKVEDKIVPLSGYWANPSFFNVFTFPFIHGNATVALKDPFTVVLTQEAANKLFGTDDVIGKTIFLSDSNEYAITGVMENVPAFSHLQFDLLVSLKTREVTEKEHAQQEMSWNSIWQGYVYLLLPQDTDLNHLQANLDNISAEQNKTIKNATIKLALQPLNEIVLGSRLTNSLGEVMDRKTVWIVGLLSFVVILSACFNYTNLSIARALKRSREVGVRKVMGASGSNVISQFIIEAIMISLLALVLSFGLFLLLKPYFLSINPALQKMLTLKLSLQTILYFILLAIGVGFLAGLFPSIFFTHLQAIHVLKSGSSVKLFKNINLRKALVVAQFTISLMFVTATVIGYKQYTHFITFDLGFKTENILNIRLQGNKANLLIKELNELPETQGVSKSGMITGIGNSYGARLKYKNPQDSVRINFITIDENYLTLHEHRLLAGRNFKPHTNAAETEVIVNEKLLALFNIGDKNPAKAIGEIVKLDGKDVEIIGVVKDYYYGGAYSDIKEVVMRYSGEKAYYVNVKLSSDDWKVTMRKIEDAWQKIDPVHPIQATFHNDQIARHFSSMLSLLKIAGALAFLAICIASLGLLGMVVFTTETRLKEISVRKVLGANEVQLIVLLSKNFLLLLAIAVLIALPVTYYFFERFALKGLLNRAPINAADLLTGVVAMFVVALLMIGSQTLKAARSNPAEVLKSE